MSARIIDGKAIAAEVRREIAAEVAGLRARGVVPGLATVLVGRDPASDSYVRTKTRTAAELGLATFDHRHPDGLSQSDLAALVARLNADPAVHGILVQLPLPDGLDARPILDAIDPRKDVDGLHPVNVGRLWSGRPGFVPCTPLGILRLIEAAGVRLSGARAVVVGRSNLVGKPVAALLLAAHSTVTLCHSRTSDLPTLVGGADLLVVAVGQPGLVRGEWIKPGATVIDVGTNRVDGKLVGDVDFAAASARACAITPVPGGVGPMTITMLMANTVKAATAIATP